MGVILEFVGLSFAVILLAWASLRFLGQRLALPHRNLRLREALSLGPNRLIALLEVAGKVYLLGISPNRIEVLDEIDPDALEETPTLAEDVRRLIPSDLLQQLEERVRRLGGRRKP